MLRVAEHEQAGIGSKMLRRQLCRLMYILKIL